MKNEEVFEQSIRDFLLGLPTTVPAGQRIIALAGIVRTNEMLYFLGPTQFFDREVDVDASILAHNVAKEVLAYSLDNDTVYFGQSVVSIPPRTAEKCRYPINGVIGENFASRLANHNITTMLDLFAINKADLKGCGFNKEERGLLRLYMSKRGLHMGSLRNPNVKITPNPTEELPSTIEVLLQYVAA